MRKLITLIVASLVPVGLWTAGCRQNNNRQAAFPNSAEMKGLAKADTSANKNKPPHIGPAPIDRDILNLPDSPAMARATAVQDRSKQMAKPKAPEDLFTLPEPSSGLASVYDPRPANISPANGNREFWSQPAMSIPAGSRFSPVPGDVSAMAPANPGSNFMSPPVQYTPPASSKKGAAGQPGRSLGYSDPMDVPGLFMDEPISFRTGSPPSSRQSLSAPYSGGDALGAPPPLTKREFTTISENPGQTTRASKSATAQQGPVKLDLSGLVGSNEYLSSFDEPVTAMVSYSSGSSMSQSMSPPMIVHAIPGDYEPLPEPIPLEQYIAMLDRQKPEPLSSSVSRSRSSYSSSGTASFMRSDDTLSFRDQSRATSSKTVAKMNSFEEPQSSTGMILPLPGVSSLAGVSQSPEKAMAMPNNFSADKAIVETSMTTATKDVSKAGMSGLSSSRIQVSDMRKALAPLPDISGGVSDNKSGESGIGEMANLPASKPAPLTIPSLEQTQSGSKGSSKASVASKGKRESLPPESSSAQSVEDFLNTDLQSQYFASFGGLPDLELPEPKKSSSASMKRKRAGVAEKKNATAKAHSSQEAKSNLNSPVQAKAVMAQPDILGITAEIQDLQASIKHNARERSDAESLSLPSIPDLEPVLPSWVESPVELRSSGKDSVTDSDADAFAASFLDELKTEALKQESISLSELPEVKAESAREKEEPANLEPPRKVKLQPMRKYRDKEISKIDAQMDVPPIRF